jgi:IS1 family transposase
MTGSNRPEQIPLPLTLPDRSSILVSMNRLDNETRSRVVACLVEGNSIRATCRLTGAAKNTVTKLLVDLGIACAVYMDRTFVNLNCKRIQCDEIWSFVGAKDKNIPADRKGEAGLGSVWTWTAIDADTKLIAAFFVGNRDAGAANYFMHTLSRRLHNRVQLTTDGHKAYLWAVANQFDVIDYAMLVKLYGPDPSGGGSGKYSPAECTGTKVEVIRGEPEPEHISTSYVERQNLTIRMSNRRFTRLTNAFSKKIENQEHALALHFMHYNFCRIHQTLRVTPAMAAGLAQSVWEIEDLVALLGDK